MGAHDISMREREVSAHPQALHTTLQVLVNKIWEGARNGVNLAGHAFLPRPVMQIRLRRALIQKSVELQAGLGDLARLCTDVGEGGIASR